jgi:phosphatidylglycerophosphate synthase
MARDEFAGDKKEGVSLLHRPEERLKAVLIPCVPQGIETYHLTLTTIVWSILIVLFSWLATFNRAWMWGVSAMIVAQYITDLLDGAIGRGRNTGLIKWGFYMDHFLDYVFLCSILIGYSLLMPDHLKYIMFFVMAVFCAFMVNSFLQFAATNEFRIAYWGIGPTEIRLGFIIINTLIIYANKSVFIIAVPYVLTVALFGLFFTAYSTQKQLWKLDMDNKAETEGSVPRPEEDLQGLVIRHFLLSFIIASLAFLVLVMQIGLPFHGILAGTLFACSWLPFLSALNHRSWIHLKANPVVRRWGALVIAGLILASSAWIAMQIRPSVAGRVQFSVQDMREGLAQDAVVLIDTQAELRILLNAGTSLDPNDSAALEQMALQFLGHQKTLSTIIEKYEGYYRIDYHETPVLHAEAFLLGFTALAMQRNSVFGLVEGATFEQQRDLLNQAVLDDGMASSFLDQLVRSLVSPNTMLKISYDSTFIRLIQEQIAGSGGELTPDTRKDLERIALRSVDEYHKKLRANPDIIVKVSKTIPQLFR